jgi:hypothetical protein
MGSRRVLLSAGAVVRSVSVAYSAEVARMSAARRVNRASTGSISVTMHGANLGLATYTAGAREGFTACERTTWEADTSIRCQSSQTSVGSRKIFATVGSCLGSATAIWTTDYTALSLARRSNVGSSGSSSITLHGTDFGRFSLSAAVAIRGSSCERTKWQADTSMACLRSQTVSSSSRLMMTSGRNSGSISLGFSADMEMLSVVQRSNSVSSGSMSITIHGAGSGLVHFTSSIRQGMSASERTSWTADTSVRCLDSHGTSGTRQISLTVGIRAGSETASMSIDIGMASTFRRTNRGSTGSASVTVLGSNMGLTSFSSALALRSTSTERTFWESDTATRCAAGAGRAQSAQVTFSAGLRVGTATEVWTLDSGTVSSAKSSNRAVTGSSSITVYGLDLALFSSSVANSVGDSAFEASEWVADTSVRSRTAAGIRGSRNVVLTAVVQLGSLSVGISLDTASLASVYGANMAKTAPMTVTVSGSDLGGIVMTTLKARVGGTAAVATIWMSQTSVVGLLTPGISATRILAMTVGGRARGSLTQVVSYSKPVISAVLVCNVPVTGSGSLTIWGSWFGLLGDTSPWARMQGSSCEQTTWVAHSSVICRMPSGDGWTGMTTVSAGRRSGTRTAATTYGTAAVSSARRANTASTGAFVIALLAGRGFGAALASPAARFGSSSCETTLWISDTVLTLLPASGVHGSRSISLTVGQKLGSASAALSFDRPSVDRWYQSGGMFPEVLVGGSGYVDGSLDTQPSPPGPIGTAFAGSFTVINGLIDSISVLVSGSRYTVGSTSLLPVYRGTTMPQGGTVTDVTILDRGINYVSGVVEVAANGVAPGFVANFSVDDAGRVLAVAIVSHGHDCGPSSQLPLMASYRWGGPSMDGTVTGVTVLWGGVNYIPGEVAIDSLTGSGFLAAFSVNSTGGVTIVSVMSSGSSYPAEGAQVRLRYPGGGVDMTDSIALVTVGAGGTGYPAGGGVVLALGGGGAGFQGEFETDVATGAITAVRVLSPGANYSSDPLLVPAYRESGIPMSGTISSVAVGAAGRNYLTGGVVGLSGAVGTGFMGSLVTLGGAIVGVNVVSNGQGVPVGMASSDLRIYYPSAVLCGNASASSVCLQAGSVTGVTVSGFGNQHYAAGPANISCLPPCSGTGFEAMCIDIAIHPSGAGDGIIDYVQVTRNRSLFSPINGFVLSNDCPFICLDSPYCAFYIVA